MASDRSPSNRQFPAERNPFASAPAPDFLHPSRPKTCCDEEELRLLLCDFRCNIENDMKKSLLGIEDKLNLLLAQHTTSYDAPVGKYEGDPPFMDDVAFWERLRSGNDQLSVDDREKAQLFGKARSDVGMTFSKDSTDTGVMICAAENVAKRPATPKLVLSSIDDNPEDGALSGSDSLGSKAARCTTAHKGKTDIQPRRQGWRMMSKYAGDGAGEQFSSLMRTAGRLSDNDSLNMGERLWEILNDRSSSWPAQVFHRIMPWFILLTVGVALLQTPEVPPLRGRIAIIADTAIDAIFMSEIIARIIAAPSKAAFFLNLYNIIDSMAAFSLIVRASSGFEPLFVADRDNRPVSLRVLSGSLPVVRLLKVLRYFEQIHLLVHAFRMALDALPALLFMYLLIILTCTALTFIVEPTKNIPTLPKAMWYSFISLTTVGYGDYVADSTAGKFVCASFVLTSTLYMAIPIGIIGNAFSEVWNARGEILLKQKVAERWYQRGFTAEEASKLFFIFDTDGDGELGFHELCEMMKQMRMALTTEEVSFLFETLDKNNDENISTKEFVKQIFPSEYHKVFASLTPEENHAATRWLQTKQMSYHDDIDLGMLAGAASSEPSPLSPNEQIM